MDAVMLVKYLDANGHPSEECLKLSYANAFWQVAHPTLQPLQPDTLKIVHLFFHCRMTLAFLLRLLGEILGSHMPNVSRRLPYSEIESIILVLHAMFWPDRNLRRSWLVNMLLHHNYSCIH